MRILKTKVDKPTLITSKNFIPKLFIYKSCYDYIV